MVSFKKNALEAVVVQLIVSICNFIWMGLVTRALSVSESGSIFVAMGIATTINTLAGFGLQHSVTISAHQYSGQLIITNGFISLCIAALVAGVGGVGVIVFLSIPKGLNTSEFTYGMLVAVQLINVYLLAFLRAVNRFRTANVVMVIQPILMSFLLLKTFAFSEPINPSDCINKYILSSVAQLLTSVAIMTRSGLIVFSVLDWNMVMNYFKFGQKAQYGNILKEAMYRSDLLLVASLLGDGDAGLYAVVLKIIEGFGRFVDAIGLIMLPTVARISKAGQDQLRGKMVILTGLGALICAISVSINKNIIIEKMFGSGFRGSIELLGIGVYGMIPLFIWKMLANDSIGRGRFGQYSLSAGLGAASIVLLNYCFLSKYGVIAAPWILLFSYSVAAVTLMVFSEMVKNSNESNKNE